jgi:hypothetical protein
VPQAGWRKTAMRSDYVAQNNVQLKTYDLFISVIFHLLFSDCRGMKKITNKEDTTVYGHGEQKKFFLCI